MNSFDGFPAGARSTPIPDLFFSKVLPEIADLGELKVTLHVFWMLFRKKGYPRFVTFWELLADPTLVQGVGQDGPPEPLIRRSLELAVSRGILLHLPLERDGEADDLYVVNSDTDRRVLERIRSGQIKIGASVKRAPAAVTKRPGIFALYEQNIGLLNPIIAEELKEAEKAYPESWIEDAFREAVELNKRNWRYIARILERWAAEGKGNGESGRHPETGITPQEYFRKWDRYLGRK